MFDIADSSFFLLPKMAHSNVFSEIEKSLDRTVSKEEFFHGVWSNEKSPKLTDTKEFNNSFPSESDEKTSSMDDLIFHNEVGNSLEIETLPIDLNHERDKDMSQTVDDVSPGVQSEDLDSSSHSASENIDYFDSEDEFFETYRNKFEEFQSMVDFGGDFCKTDNKDRYCKSQYINYPNYAKKKILIVYCDTKQNPMDMKRG